MMYNVDNIHTSAMPPVQTVELGAVYIDQKTYAK
jgi:hypothetical protein